MSIICQESLTQKEHQDETWEKGQPDLFSLFNFHFRGTTSVLSSHSQDCSLVSAVVVAAYIPV